MAGGQFAGRDRRPLFRRLARRELLGWRRRTPLCRGLDAMLAALLKRNASDGPPPDALIIGRRQGDSMSNLKAVSARRRSGGCFQVERGIDRTTRMGERTRWSC